MEKGSLDIDDPFDLSSWEVVLHEGESINGDANMAEMGDYQLQSSTEFGGTSMILSEGSAFKDPQPSTSFVFEEVVEEAGLGGTAALKTEYPKAKRKRESVEYKPLRQGVKILGDRTDRLKKKVETTNNRLKLLCLQTRPENLDLLNKVDQLIFASESELQSIKNDIKDISEEGKEGNVTDEEKQHRFKETQHKLDNVNTKHSKLNSEVEKLEILLMRHKSASKDSMEVLKKELNAKFPELFNGETAIVGGQLKAAAPNIPMLLQGIVTNESIIPVSAAIKEMVDSKLEQLDSPMLVEWEAVINSAKEAGFQEEKDAETSLMNILSIYIAFKMKQK